LTIEDVVRKIGDVSIVPVVRAATVDEATRVVEAVLAGGISIVEITMTVPNATEVIRQVVRQYGDDVLTGAGTVLTSDEAKRCLDVGAEFLVSPGVSVPVMSTARACGKLAVPGALTPTELMNACEAGARLVKIFPCGNLGGSKYLKSLRGPFPNVSLVPTGGVNALNAADYMAAGAFALGVGLI
jgi:2-dehydro-3-deoxyphosphogluconate aldolase/(4S)-4-hydroxy-2-oxoglutarate aldolase